MTIGFRKIAYGSRLQPSIVPRHVHESRSYFELSRPQVYSRTANVSLRASFYPYFASRRVVVAQGSLPLKYGYYRCFCLRCLRVPNLPRSWHPSCLSSLWDYLAVSPSTVHANRPPRSSSAPGILVMLQQIPFPILPAPPSWFPGHMNQFKRRLPALLKQTDVVLELRDARLPLTSINRTFEGWLALILISPLQGGHGGQDAVATKHSLRCGERVYWCSFYTAAVQLPLFIRVAWSAPISAAGTSVPLFSSHRLIDRPLQPLGVIQFCRFTRPVYWPLWNRPVRN